jgi:hypothetical protein
MRRMIHKLRVYIPLILLFTMCITQEEPIVESARIEHLKEAEIEIDGSFSDWRGISPVYEDSEKSMFCFRSDEYLAIRIDFVFSDPEKENYFVEIDTNFDEAAEYRVELNGIEERTTVEKHGIFGWKEITADTEGAVTSSHVEIKFPLALIGEGFFITGWAYDTSLENITAHFPWVRSLYPETGFDPAKMTRNDWKEDFEAFYYFVKYNYPYLWVKERTHGFNWLDLKDQYMRRLDRIETSEEFLLLIKEAVATLHNRHSALVDYTAFKFFVRENPKAFAVRREGPLEAVLYWEMLVQHSYPEVFFLYEGGEYVALRGVKFWEEKYGLEKGSKVTAVNGKDVHKAVKSLVNKTLLRHDIDRDRLYAWYLDPSLFGEDPVFTVETGGELVEKHIQCVPMPFEEFATILSTFEGDVALTFRFWEDKNVAYMRIPFFYSVTFEDLPGLYDFYDTIREYDALIIDIRCNGGGNDLLWRENVVKPLATTNARASFYVAYRQGKYVNQNRRRSASLSKEGVPVPPEVKTNNFLLDDISLGTSTPEGRFSGNIYLLVDKEVYSASESFAAFVKATGFAQIVGTTTGGDGIAYTVSYFSLPNSRLVIQVPTCMGINSDGTANEETHTSPDVYVDWSQFENDEKLLQYVLEEIIGV